MLRKLLPALAFALALAAPASAQQVTDQVTASQNLVNSTIVQNSTHATTSQAINNAFNSLYPIFRTLCPSYGPTGLCLPASTTTDTLLIPPTSRTMSSYLGDVVDVRNYGAKCDGAFDNGPLFNTLFATHTTLLIPATGCLSTYLINTTVNVPPGGQLLGYGMKGNGSGNSTIGGILTSAAVDTFLATGDKTSFEGLYVNHVGSAGSILNLAGTSWAEVINDEFSATSPTSTSHIIYGYGTQHKIAHTKINNYRPNAYAIAVDSKTNPSPFAIASVNWDIDGDFIFGDSRQPTIPPATGCCGPGILIYSTSGNNGQAPQGIMIRNTTIQTPNQPNLQINQVVNLIANNNTYDGGTGIIFQPTVGGQGIIGVQIQGGYVSTPGLPSTGVCVNQASNGAGISHTQIQGLLFAVCGYGVAFNQGNIADLHIEGNSFSGMGAAAINVQGSASAALSQVVIAHNICSGCATNLILADGSNASSGGLIVSNNSWDPTGTMGITQTNPLNFAFGATNTGKKLAGTAAATATLSTTGAGQCTSVNIPHGLVAAPNPDKIIVSARALTGAFQNVTTAIGAYDVANIGVQVCATVTTAGTIRVVEQSSL